MSSLITQVDQIESDCLILSSYRYVNIKIISHSLQYIGPGLSLLNPVHVVLERVQNLAEILDILWCTHGSGGSNASILRNVQQDVRCIKN